MSNNQKIDAAFNQFNQKIEELKRNLPTLLAEDAVNETLDNFENESFNGVPWAKRKGKDQSRKLLVKRRILSSSPQAYGYKSNGFVLGSDVEYAAVHNYGLSINRSARTAIVAHKAFKKGIKKGKTLFAKNDITATFSQKVKIGAYSYKMPQRQFIGDTPQLRRRLNATARAEFNRLFKKI